MCQRGKIGTMSIAHPAPASGAERFRILYELLAAMSRATALEEIYDAALTSLLRTTGADHAAIVLSNEERGIQFKASGNIPCEFQDAIAGYSPWPRGAGHPQPVVVPDVLLDESLAKERDVLLREGIRALVFVPLAIDGALLGKFILSYAEPHACTADELDVASAIAVHVAQARGERRLRAISDHLAAEQLQQANLHLAAIIESSDDAIVSKDFNGIITSWNKGAERIFGYSAAEVIGKPVSILTAPDRLDEMPAILRQIQQGNRVEQYETRRRRKDGEIIDVALTVSPVRNAAGQVVGASKIARDISDRKRAEQERALLLSHKHKALQTAELLNRVSLRLSAQLDLEKLVQEVTDIARVLVGAEFGSFSRNVLNEKGESYVLNTLSGAPREAFAGFPMPRNTDVFAPAFRGEAVVRCDDVTQDPRYGKNPPHCGMPEGHLPLRSYLAAPVVARSGEVLGGIFFGHSVPGKFTAAHEPMVTGIAAQAAIAMDNARLFEQAAWAQTELRRSNEELRRANQDLEVFAYSASHDLQEPLRSISISAQIIKRNWGGQLQSEAAMFLENILAGSNRMTILIEDLLAYTRATKYEEGPPPIVDSARVLATVLKSLHGTLEEAGATVTAAELPMVAIHESRLAQLFQNLISNATKYRSKEIPRVHIAAEERDGWCTFSVTDNGIGIERKFAEQIFGLFKRLHGRDEYPGSGIGLAICQRVVEQYGGRIWLEQSTPGGGSTFCFSLPARTK